MLKKLTLFTTVFAIFLLFASSANAMLRVLDTELSDELKAIAKQYLTSERNIDADAITIDEAWLREFFNLKVDVYMIETTIDQGLSTEQKIQIPVRVDTKLVLSEDDLAKLTEEDNALSTGEPIARTMSITVEEDADVAADTILTETPVTGNNFILYIAGAILVAAILGGAFIFAKRRA